MKTYVFLTNSITNMGGAQMLIRNKMLDLECRGWDVQIFYYFSGDEIIIPEFKKFANNRIKELQYPFYAYSRRRRNLVIDRIASIINNTDEVIIESDFFQLSFWGELIASKVNGINILYFIGEEFPVISGREEKFLLFKQYRHEFVNSISIKKKYSKSVASLHNDEDTLKIPSYNNVFADIAYTIEYDKSYPVITSVGRLEKKYILPMVKGVVEFAETNNRIVNLFFVGDAEYDIYIMEIRKVLSKTSKVIPYFLGYLYPIPLSIIKSTDVAIAVSGSVKVAASNNIPTISYCVEDCYPLGVYGHTTQSRLFRTTEPVVSLSQLLYDIIIDGKYKETINYEDVDSKKIYKRNAELIDALLENERNYYECDQIYPLVTRSLSIVKRILRNFLRRSSIIRRIYRFVMN